MDITSRLKPHVADIVADAAGDDERLSRMAQQIISLHRMHVSCPRDPGAPALCEAAFNEWVAARGRCS